MTRTSVSVVIPTIGRPEIVRAIRSVRAQRGFDVEVVVVNDHRDQSATDGLDADRVLWTGGGRRGGHARNAGVDATSGEYVTFLDDDDEWLPSKLSDQMKILDSAADPSRVVVSGRHVHTAEKTGASSRPGPDHLIAPGEPVDAYLFRRRRPTVGRASMYTSTLLCSGALAREVPWREDLPRHQDWDWLVRVGEVNGVTFAHAPEVVARIQTGSARSISSGADWQASKSWADETLTDDAVYVDFLIGQTLRYALNARSQSGVSEVLRAVRRKRRFPAVGPLALGLAGVVPRSRFEGLMTRARRGAPS
ncbi:glycosyltransferase family 2 protein [Microbacterium sp. P07]|uniref:glycosyltransferase family 2 protein n=1 Tax=Microbacterium sp. P07 TaxID=3366952 RepID=UPI0037463AA6